MTQFPWADQLRVYAALAVIALHVSAHALFNSPDLNNPEKFWIIFVNAATRWSVPVFVMLSGMLILPKQESFKKIVTGRGAKIIGLIVIWSGIYGLFLRIAGTPLTTRSMLSALWHGGMYYHLYFLYIIAGLYLASPFLNSILKRFNKTQEIILITISLAVACAYNWCDIMNGAPILHLNIITWWLPFVGYYLYGNYIAQHAPQLKPQTYITIFWFIIIVMAFGTQTTGHLRYFFDFLSPFTAITAWAIFNWARARVPKNWPINRLTSLTLGTYLSHPVILRVIENMWPTIYHISPFISVPALFLFVSALSFIFVYYFFFVKRAISMAVKPQPYP